MVNYQDICTIKPLKNILLFLLCTVLAFIIHNDAAMAVTAECPVVRPYIEAKGYPVVKWPFQKGYTYRVYRAMGKGGKYKCVAKDIRDNYYKDPDISLKKDYWYKVMVTKKVNGRLRFGGISKAVKFSGMLLAILLDYYDDDSYGHLEWNTYGSAYRYKVLRADSYKGN